MLSRHVQDDAARHQERQTGSRGDELCEARSRLAQVLDVVQNEQELLWCDRGGERVERRLARIVRDAERAGDRGQDQRVIAQRRELHERDAVCKRAPNSPGGFDRESRLPAAPRAGERDQPGVAPIEERAELVEVTLAAHERCRRHGKARRRRGSLRGRGEFGVVLEDPSLQLAQARPRFEPDLLAQPSADVRVVLQRLRLPPAAVERDHRLSLQPLAVRVLARNPENLGEHLLMSPEVELRVDPLFHGHETKLLQPLGLARRHLLVGQVPVRAPAPETEGPVGERGREGGVSGAPSCSALAEKALEACRVELLGCELDRRTRRRG